MTIVKGSNKEVKTPGIASGFRCALSMARDNKETIQVIDQEQIICEVTPDSTAKFFNPLYARLFGED